MRCTASRPAILAVYFTYNTVAGRFLSGKMMARHLDWVHLTGGIQRDFRQFPGLKPIPSKRRDLIPPTSG